MKKIQMIFWQLFICIIKVVQTFFLNDLLTLEFVLDIGITHANTAVEGDSELILKALKEGGLSLTSFAPHSRC